MRVILTLLLAGLLAWVAYWRLEGLGRRAWVAAVARALAWTALGLLLLDLTCAGPAGPGRRPLVLLDGSLSMVAAGGRWAEARDSARAWGEVRLFGDQRPGADSLPDFGRSDLAPALAGALASDRQVIVVSDGEISDAADLPAEASGRVTIRLFPRSGAADVAVSRVSGPVRVTAGDTVRLEAEIRAFGGGPDSARIEAQLDQRVLAARTIRVGAGGTARAALAFGSRGLSGDQLIRVAIIRANDAEPRNDARLFLVRVTPTPGVVLLASPGDWDARYLLAALRDVARLPVRGFTRIEPGRWRAMETLAPVANADVEAAARKADVVVLKGESAALPRNSRARGLWLWPSGEDGETVIPGEWYALAPPASPVAGAFIGLPVDSFPPLLQVTPIEPARSDWVGLTAQQARRGTERPVLTGAEVGTRRRVTVAADGLWRWAFRGGSSEQAYRALVAGTLSWLLGGLDTEAARARPIRAVVPNGRPVVFEWSGSGAPTPTVLRAVGVGSTRVDTLRFDGAGHAEVWLPVGRYRYALDGGGDGVIAVDEWSEEWLPRPSQLAARDGTGRAEAGITSSRQWVWLFLMLVLALAGEWFARRRLGLR